VPLQKKLQVLQVLQQVLAEAQRWALLLLLP
jgi:hypothetical protein